MCSSPYEVRISADPLQDLINARNASFVCCEPKTYLHLCSQEYAVYASKCCSFAGRGKGRAIVLCVGGAREALLAEPDHFELVLGKRLVGTGNDPFSCIVSTA